MTKQNFSDSENPVFQKWKWMIPDKDDEDEDEE